MTSAGLRIVIAEDAAIMRDGLTQTLSRRGHDVVAAVADAEALTRAVDEHLPDVAIIDVRMPPTHTDEGLQAALAISSVARGGTVLDPEVVRQLLGAGRHADSLASLTGREREVLSLIAQGRSNTAIAGALFITPGVVEKHVANIFAKLRLAPSDSDNRRVIAAIRYLEERLAQNERWWSNRV